MTSTQLEEKNKLTWTDKSGNTYTYYEKPILRVCSFILIQEACERLAFYGLTPTFKPFLRDVYGFTDVSANSFVLIFNGLSYASPVISAIISDTFLGVYNTILVFSGIYFAGLVMVCIAAIDGVDQIWMLYVGVWFLLAVGTGGIKSCISVLGGQQIHPSQKETMTSFFTLFYAAINFGAIVGGFAVPAVCKEVSYFAGYAIPVVAFAVATVVLIIGSKRYVMIKPEGSVVVQILNVIAASIGSLSLRKCRKSQGGRFEDHFIDDAASLFTLLPFFAMIIPFMVAYFQISTVYESQTAKMDLFIGSWEMPTPYMCNIDPIAVIIGAFLMDKLVYPKLRAMNRMPSIPLRVSFGFILASAANWCAMGVEMIIKSSAPKSVSVWLQIPQFSLVAFGEIFVFATALEVAYTKSPDSLKTVATAFYLLAMSISGFISGAILQACKSWFDQDNYDSYYIVLACICAAFAVISFLLRGHFERAFSRAEAQKEISASRNTLIVVTTDDETNGKSTETEGTA
jgi:peptide/histidine transporter 3/4